MSSRQSARHRDRSAQNPFYDRPTLLVSGPNLLNPSAWYESLVRCEARAHTLMFCVHRVNPDNKSAHYSDPTNAFAGAVAALVIVLDMGLCPTPITQGGIDRVMREVEEDQVLRKVVLESVPTNAEMDAMADLRKSNPGMTEEEASYAIRSKRLEAPAASTPPANP